jgi:hypothetical protein
METNFRRESANQVRLVPFEEEEEFDDDIEGFPVTDELGRRRPHMNRTRGPWQQWNCVKNKAGNKCLCCCGFFLPDVETGTCKSIRKYLPHPWDTPSTPLEEFASALPVAVPMSAPRMARPAVPVPKSSSLEEESSVEEEYDEMMDEEEVPTESEEYDEDYEESTSEETSSENTTRDPIDDMFPALARLLRA